MYTAWPFGRICISSIFTNFINGCCLYSHTRLLDTYKIRTHDCRGTQSHNAPAHYTTTTSLYGLGSRQKSKKNIIKIEKNQKEIFWPHVNDHMTTGTTLNFIYIFHTLAKVAFKIEISPVILTFLVLAKFRLFFFRLCLFFNILIPFCWNLSSLEFNCIWFFFEKLPYIESWNRTTIFWSWFRTKKIFCQKLKMLWSLNRF